MFTENQIKILLLLTGHPEKEFYLSEIAEIFSKKPGIFQKGLNALEKEGIIKSRRDGNRRLFRLNEDYPLLPEIKSIIQKTAGIEEILKQTVENIEGINIALIFGSYAKDLMRANSDIDVLLVGNSEGEKAFLDSIGSIETTTRREINYRFYSDEEFKEKISLNDPFLEDILSDKYILLKGQI